VGETSGGLSSFVVTPIQRLKKRIPEGIVRTLLFVCALVSVVTLVMVLSFLLWNAYPFFRVYPIIDFLTGKIWDPSSNIYGVLPLLVATFLVSLVAAVIAIPIGIGCSIYLSEVASPRIKNYLKPIIEVLAGIPSVILGLFAALILSEWIMAIFHPPTTSNGLVGAVMLAVMMVPIQVTIAEDAIHSVPGNLREASFALGATKWETIRGVVVPAALSGIIASIVLAMGRAIGETMVVLMACGNAPQYTWNILKPIETMTAALAQNVPEAASGTTEFYALFSVGLLLFILTFGVNIIADLVLTHYREAYK